MSILSDDWDEYTERRSDRATEHGVNNPAYFDVPEDSTPGIDNATEKLVFTCMHWEGCDRVLDGTEPSPGYFCNEHYNDKGNRKWKW